jgi:hypothetical protein
MGEIHHNTNAQRSKRLEEKGLARFQVAGANTDVIEHDSISVCCGNRPNVLLTRASAHRAERIAGRKVVVQYMSRSEAPSG